MQQIPPPNSLYHSDRSKRLRTALAVLLLLLLAASLVPVLLVGRYARASADDYSYGFYTHYAVQNGQCLLPAIWRMVWGNWRTWQGSFSAMALMTITPCIFSEQLYWLTPVVMLASLLLGTFKLSRTLVCRCSGGDWRDWICTAATMLLLSIQLIPSPLNSFYWWNGACYYTFTYGVGLLYLDAFANVLLRPERPRWRLIPGLLCGIFVGGSNYVSALLQPGGALSAQRGGAGEPRPAVRPALPAAGAGGGRLCAPGRPGRGALAGMAGAPPVPGLDSAPLPAGGAVPLPLPLARGLCGARLPALRRPERAPLLRRVHRRAPAAAQHRLSVLLLAPAAERVVLSGVVPAAGAPADSGGAPGPPVGGALVGRRAEHCHRPMHGSAVPRHLDRRVPAGAFQRHGGRLRRRAG